MSAEVRWLLSTLDAYVQVPRMWSGEWSGGLCSPSCGLMSMLFARLRRGVSGSAV